MLLQNLLKLESKKVAYGLGGILVVFILLSFSQYQELKTERARLQVAETALKNPKVVEVVRTVKVAGPVHTIYKFLEKPDGTKEVQADEMAYGYSEEAETAKQSEAQKVADIEAPPASARADRWLLALDLRNFAPNTYTSYTAYVGYSFRNRVDLLAGAGMRDDRVEPHVMAVARF